MELQFSIIKQTNSGYAVGLLGTIYMPYHVICFLAIQKKYMFLSTKENVKRMLLYTP